MRLSSLVIPVIFPHLFWAPMQSNTFSFEGDIDAVTTTSTNYQLVFDIKIRTKKLWIDQYDRSNDVFKGNYDLSTLKEIKKCIEKKSHLSHMLSVAETKADVIWLGEMNMKWLKKILG